MHINTRQSEPECSCVCTCGLVLPLLFTSGPRFLFVCLSEAYYPSFHLAVSRLPLSFLITGCQGRSKVIFQHQKDLRTRCRLPLCTNDSLGMKELSLLTYQAVWTTSAFLYSCYYLLCCFDCLFRRWLSKIVCSRVKISTIFRYVYFTWTLPFSFSLHLQHFRGNILYFYFTTVIRRSWRRSYLSSWTFLDNDSLKKKDFTCIFSGDLILRYDRPHFCIPFYKVL